MRTASHNADFIAADNARRAKRRKQQAERYLVALVHGLCVEGQRLEALKQIRARLRDDGKDSSLPAARLWASIHGITL